MSAQENRFLEGLGCFRLIAVGVDNALEAFLSMTRVTVGFPACSVVNNVPANAGDAGTIPG